jgi:glycosyltransferase involved in cell wall biosynthesis
VHVTYVILSPTFGIHQGTADLANLQVMPLEGDQPNSQAKATVLTIFGAPIDRYASQVVVQPMVSMRGTGLQRTSFDLRSLWKVYRAILNTHPDVVHFNGPHIWNPILLWLLRRAGIATVQTIHDLDPHSGVSYGRLLYAWNDLVVQAAKHILVYGQAFRTRLINRGIAPDRITYLPLLHLFVSYENERQLKSNGHAQTDSVQSTGDGQPPFALFFARIEAYKGVDVLVDAMRRIEATATHTPSSGAGQAGLRAIIAGKGELRSLVDDTLPSNVEVRSRQIEDEEAIDLFSRCSVVVLPYRDATQSALIAAAYFFAKPVIVTHVGALPEYVVDGVTGWVIEPGNSQALADCLQAAFDHPERLTRMGEAGRAWYQAQRCVEHKTLLEMYQRIGTTSS